MKFIPSFGALELDIVGIVAILGEGSTSRNAQASSLSWWHVLPRLYPAPQSLLQPSGETELPTAKGTVVGAHSGRIRHELNFFTQLLHQDDLPPYSVQIVQVNRKKHPDGKNRPTFRASSNGHLPMLSILGFAMSITLLGLSIWQQDGPACVATVLLSMTSSLAGMASYAHIDDTEEVPDSGRKEVTPLADVVIFYPKSGAFRVVRCNEETNRLYFRIEICYRYLSDNHYRLVAFFATFTLMGGLIMLGNSQAILQAAFAASYVVLNGLYWASSALDPLRHVWESDFEVKELGYTKRMVRHKAGNILPEYSELSPPNAIFTHRMIEKSTQFFHNRHWRPRKGVRVPTAIDIEREGEIVVVSKEAQKPNLVQSALRIVGIAKGPGGAYELPTWVKSSDPSSQVLVPVLIRILSMSNDDMAPVKRKLTSALWTVVALTGSARWARTCHVAPDTEVWDKWLGAAEEVATARWSDRHNTFVPPCLQWLDAGGKIWIELPKWNYGSKLGVLMGEQSEAIRRRFEQTIVTPDVEIALQTHLSLVIALRIMCRRFRRRRQQALAAEPHASAADPS